LGLKPEGGKLKTEDRNRKRPRDDFFAGTRTREVEEQMTEDSRKKSSLPQAQ